MEDLRIKLLTFLLSVGVIYGQHEKCPSTCRCSSGKADCSNLGINNIPQGYDSQVRLINLRTNKITKLAEGSFEKLDNILSITLGLNEMVSIGANSFKSVSTLMKLDLASNKIAHIHSEALAGLTELRTLSLSNNRLPSMNQILKNLPNLSSVNLAFNALTTVEENDFEINEYLRMLDLSHNLITTIHPGAFRNLRYLRYLILANNPISHLPEMNMGPSMLQLLDFTKCKLRSIPRGLSPSVSDLRLSNNLITHINETDFKNATGLRLITLNNNEISIIEDNAFNNSHKLDEVWLNNNKLNYIPRGFPATINALHMDFNKVIRIESGTFSKDSGIQLVSLQSNNIMMIHANALQGLNNLTKINLQGNQLTQLLSKVFSKLPKIQTINLINNPINDIKWGAFKGLKSLQNIQMSYNMEDLVKLKYNMLVEIPNIKQIDLMSSPGLTKSFLKMVAKFKRPAMPKTRSLNLMYNNLQTLPRNIRRKFPKLKSLLLEGNIWRCDKRLLQVKRWIKKYKLKTFRGENPKCYNPETARGTSVVELSDSKFIKVPGRKPSKGKKNKKKNSILNKSRQKKLKKIRKGRRNLRLRSKKRGKKNNNKKPALPATVEKVA